MGMTDIGTEWGLCYRAPRLCIAGWTLDSRSGDYYIADPISELDPAGWVGVGHFPPVSRDSTELPKTSGWRTEAFQRDLRWVVEGPSGMLRRV